jgi:cell division protein FtsQ
MSPGAATPAGRLGGSLPRLPRVRGGARRLRARARALLASKRLRRRLLFAAATMLLLASGYQFWLRDSSLVAVERVTVTGLSGSDSESVRLALTSAGRSMTTLHVDHEALERAVAGFPVVRELEVTTDFPHGLEIHVVEHVPAAIAVGKGGRVPVAGDGTILQGIPVEGRLPTLEIDGAVGVERLRDPAGLAAASIAGAAPTALRARIEAIELDGDLGQVAKLRDGPELVFGDASRVRDKWAAAARVLADLEASGASYIDVRIPDRPAVGGLPAETIVPVAPAGETTTIPETPTDEAAAATDPAAAATVPPATATVPPTGETVPPAGTSPAAGTVTQTGTAPPAETTAPAPAAPLEGGTGGGATAVP